MRNAALKNGSNKSGDVADDAAAQTNHKRTPIEPRLDQLVADFLDLRERLRFFAGRNSDQMR